MNFPATGTHLLVPGHLSKREKVLRKMKENKILIRDRSSFTNLDDCVRITIGSKKQIIRVLDVLSN